MLSERKPWLVISFIRIASKITFAIAKIRLSKTAPRLSIISPMINRLNIAMQSRIKEKPAVAAESCFCIKLPMNEDVREIRAPVHPPITKSAL